MNITRLLHTQQARLSVTILGKKCYFISSRCEFQKRKWIVRAGCSVPTPSTIGLKINKVSFVDDEQAIASAFGTALVPSDEQSIQDYESTRYSL